MLTATPTSPRRAHETSRSTSRTTSGERVMMWKDARASRSAASTPRMMR